MLYKLLSFTFAMVTLPLGTYFFVTNYVLVGEYLPIPINIPK